MNRHTTQLLVLGLVFSVTACRCQTGGPTQTRGQPRLFVETDGVNAEATSLDFGTVPMGKRVTGVVTLSNALAGPLQVESWERVGTSPPVKLGTGMGEPGAIFGLEYEPGSIEGGGSRQLNVFFDPPNDSMRTEVAHEVKLILKTSNSTEEQVEFTLKGKAIRGECDLPDSIDFGAVARGDTFGHTILLKNPRAAPTSPKVNDITSQNGDKVFGYSPDSPRGEFVIAGGREKTVTVQFMPSEAREYFAVARIRPADGCPEQNVRLVGLGVDQVITWQPELVQFGYVQPGQTISRQVTFTNQAFRAVTINRLVVKEMDAVSTVYSVTRADMGDVTKLTVPPAHRDPMTNTVVPGSATVTLEFKPTLIGPRNNAMLMGAPDLPRQTEIGVPLRGFGGGPDIDVTPTPTLNFGRIAYFAGAGSFATRKATLRNVGTRPSVSDPAANLKLGRAGAGKPYWAVTPKNPASSLDEICVGTYDVTNTRCVGELPGYDEQLGIEAAGARASLDVPIRITPANTNVGPNMTKEWEVTFFSSDPDEPSVTINVTARPVVLPPCNYSVAPQNLAYGVVTPPSTKDLSFQVCNRALASSPQETCLLTNLDLEAGSDATFTLPGGPQDEIELAPQECTTVIARAWPQGALPANPTGVTGAVSFNLSSPTAPQARVQLTATLAPSCLVISPNSLDFGTVKRGCNSQVRNFELYNSCSQPVQWVGADFASAAGVPAGSTGCPGMTSCPEFEVVTAPSAGSLPPCATGTGSCLVQGGASVRFQLKYHPLDLGTDTGAYRISVVQAGQPVDYLVNLLGRGDDDGSNTDTFQQDARPKADILLVIDSSCSMADKQMNLARNFNSFIKFATTSRVDFQIGITTTDFGDDLMCPNCVTGDLKASMSGTKIFTPGTPSLEMQFQQTVTVGTTGSHIESCVVPAVRALTAPKVTDSTKNGGLVRPDAVLAVVCVTDADDQMTQPVSFYLNQLLNIKGAQRSGSFTYNVIGPFLPSPPTTNCMYDGSGDDGRHVQLVSQTNGVKEEICTPAWAAALENIGKNAFGFRTNFFLKGIPDLSGGNVIRVEVDGMVLPEIDSRGSRVWRFDAASNAIIFEPLFVPEPGRTLTVHYKVACL